MPTESIADSVRLALPAEAPVVAALQRRAWDALEDRTTGAALLAQTDLPAMTAAWEQSVRRPPDARCRVLVAVGQHGVAGVAATSPATDGDADPLLDGAITELTVDPAARRLGHGGRLLNACADTLRADGFTAARIWVPSTDDVLRRWLTAAGWAPDGAHSEIGTDEGDRRLRLVRLHTDLREA